MATYAMCYGLGGAAAALGYSASRDCDWWDWLRATNPGAHRQITGDFGSMVFFACGLRGLAAPQLAIGWRWGDVPAGGRSLNTRVGRGEAGVSVMAAWDTHWQPLGTTADCWSALFCAVGRRAMWVRGYLNPLAVGGDGEPLLIACDTI